jgi:hypothetical protein
MRSPNNRILWLKFFIIISLSALLICLQIYFSPVYAQDTAHGKIAITLRFIDPPPSINEEVLLSVLQTTTSESLKGEDEEDDSGAKLTAYQTNLSDLTANFGSTANFLPNGHQISVTPANGQADRNLLLVYFLAI